MTDAADLDRAAIRAHAERQRNGYVSRPADEILALLEWGEQMERERNRLRGQREYLFKLAVERLEIIAHTQARAEQMERALADSRASHDSTMRQRDELQAENQYLRRIAMEAGNCAQAAESELRDARKLAEDSETWRKAYQEGKHALYAMGGEIQQAAMQHLPCNEGNLDRLHAKVLEYPRLRAAESERDEWRARAAALLGVLDLMIRGVTSDRWFLERDAVMAMTRAALAAPDSQPGADSAGGQ